jgi:hypothetical protein
MPPFNPSLPHTLRRDWLSWSRNERIGALALLIAFTLVSGLALAQTLAG